MGKNVSNCKAIWNYFLQIFMIIAVLVACTSESPYYQQAVNFEAEASIVKALQAIEKALQEQPQNPKYINMKNRLLIMAKK